MDWGGHGGREGGSELGVQREGENWEMPRESLSSGEGSCEITEASKSNGGHSPRAVLKAEDLVNREECSTGLSQQMRVASLVRVWMILALG